MKKLAPALLFILFLAVTWYLLSKSNPHGLNLAGLKALVLSSGGAGPLFLILLYVVATVMLFPATIVTLVAGALYGPWAGSFYVLVGSNIGASCAFWLARYFGFEFAKKAFHTHFPKAEVEIKKNGFLWTFGLRVLPITPFGIFNYLAGVTPLRWRDYALGSLIGMFPMTFLYVTLGSAIGEISETGRVDWQDPKNWIPFLIAFGVATLVATLKRRKKITSE